MTGGGNVTII